MKRILVIFAHPAIQKSRINQQMIRALRGLEWVTVNDLYDNYPDFYIDVIKEQQLLMLHDIIVWHHPFYWYSCPSLLKEWFDLVLEHDFAYGKKGTSLEEKDAISVLTTGARKEVYSEKGRNRYTINQFLIPFQQSAALCKMNYLPPFVVHGSYTIPPEEINNYAEQYKKLILSLRDEKLDRKKINSVEYLNELIENNA
ncbi:glutathione-regulated potassium-efflux system oxidoreductase KefF [Maribellus maritimus]|uniref:glutathione-regulated potassium-efflux system oxidoreductase KefF n=1 Tax=Maribellus maritimus TaxID=2870838 RepID=UPI001EEAA6DE|nr:NAD(P)H-dependent oxidoreductase [Maribellus maritimus]MCG6187046.1 NAD(P)H-dependent oxidoreductase [Maribellus maritimus]